jgi:hypothetical protein
VRHDLPCSRNSSLRQKIKQQRRVDALAKVKEVEHARERQVFSALVKLLSWMRDQGALELSRSALIMCEPSHAVFIDASSPAE